MLVGGRDNRTSRNPEERQAAEFRRVWINELQPSLTRLSTRGKQIILPNAGHGIGYANPGAVVNAVKDVVDQVGARR